MNERKRFNQQLGIERTQRAGLFFGAIVDCHARYTCSAPRCRMRSGAFSVDRRIPSRSRAQSNHDLKANVQRQTQTNTNKQLTPTPHEHPHVQHHTPPASSIVQRIFALFASCRRVFASLPCCVCGCVCGALPLSRSYPQATLIVRSFLCVSRTHSSIRSLPLCPREPHLYPSLYCCYSWRAY